MDCSLPGSSVHRIFQARILEWIAISSSRRSSLPRNWTQVSWIAGRFFTDWAMREAIWVDRKKHSLMILILELTNPQRSWEGSLEFLYQDHFPILNILEGVNDVLQWCVCYSKWTNTEALSLREVHCSDFLGFYQLPCSRIQHYMESCYLLRLLCTRTVSRAQESFLNTESELFLSVLINYIYLGSFICRGRTDWREMGRGDEFIFSLWISPID